MQKTQTHSSVQENGIYIIYLKFNFYGLLIKQTFKGENCVHLVKGILLRG